jgi:hypothetical protein
MHSTEPSLGEAFNVSSAMRPPAPGLFSTMAAFFA